MKKSTIIGKKQLLTLTMVIALGAAVWLNVKFSTNGTEFSGTSSIPDADLGNTKYVANTAVVEKDSDENDYFTSARKERENSREEQIDIIKEVLGNTKSTDNDKKQSKELIAKVVERIEQENSIETLIKAKGFKDAIAVVSDETCNVVVKKSKELTDSEMVQIIDIVSGATKINLENIKIVNVK